MQLTARRTSIFERLERFAATKPAIIGLLALRLFVATSGWSWPSTSACGS